MKINSLHTYSWKPLLKIDAELFPHAPPADAQLLCINLIIGRPSLTGQRARPSVRRIIAATFGPDTGDLQTADSAHHILPPPLLLAPAPTRLRAEAGARQRRREERARVGQQEIQTKFGSFMIYDCREARITFLLLSPPRV